MIKVIFADDEALMTQGFLNSIDWEAHGYEIIGAVKNPQLVLGLCQENKPDIAILDINMPGISGLDLLKELRERYPEIFVIILTAYNNFDFARDALRYKADEYLLKPEIEFEDVLKVMDKFKEKMMNARNRQAEKEAGEGQFDRSKFYDAVLPYEGKNIPTTYDKLIEKLEVQLKINDFNEVKNTVSKLFVKFEEEKPLADDLFKLITRVLFIFEDKISKYHKEISEILEIEKFNPITELSRFKKYIPMKEWFYACYQKLLSFLVSLEGQEQSKLVYAVFEYINANIENDELNLMEVSKKVNVSYSYLSRLFTDVTGKHFNKYVTEMRMEKAKEIFSKSDMKIHIVSSKVGYKNISYFIKLFKKYTGQTPMEFKEAVRKHDGI